MIKTYHDKYRNILKSAKSRINIETFKKKLENFQSEAKNSLFDIAACKCVVLSLCNCEKSRKVPTIEQVFIIDQRTTRKMVMTSIDISTTKKLQKKIIRKETDAKRIEKKKLSVVNEINFNSDEVSTEIDDSDEDCIAVLNTLTSSSIKNSQMRFKLPALAMACDRTEISDRLQVQYFRMLVLFQLILKKM
ncbi:unnamed protein product [Macrosiphum euphorbiae]|uniref:Uncharacterized protein n=1 Tax=Macrosiphum euphorbiae TaxID=13131 RepID=A0AAV0Y7S1_9HEMI|nr:unnamed protein product [Macrosiphum euphorbiae]